MKIRHFLYNSFLIENGKNKIAIDPGQNLWIFKLGSLIPKTEWKSITHILITHGDPDHYWQSDRVAQASNAPVVCGKELAKVENGKTLLVDPRGRGLTSWVPFKNVHPLDIGESVILGDVEIQALKTVLKPDVLMLPIGGPGNNTWTMDVTDALEAVKIIAPKKVIPCHYNIAFFWIKNIASADDQLFKREVEKLGVECSIMRYGDEIEI